VPARLLVLLLAAPLAAAAQDEDTYSEPRGGGTVNVMGWGGAMFDLGNQNPSAGLYGGEISYSLSSLDLGVMGEAYRLGTSRSNTEWSPVILARIEQRFETLRGTDAVLALGLGAARLRGWQAWYQIAFGLRLGFGPAFVAGEVGFEQLSLFRLAAGLGVRF
jgi:hypothetical protein